MGTSWYFSWKMNYFGILKWKQGLFNIPQSGHESVYLLEPSFHSRTPNNSTFMKNISWCPCLKVRVNFLPRRNYAAHFTVCHEMMTWLHETRNALYVWCVSDSVLFSNVVSGLGGWTWWWYLYVERRESCIQAVAGCVPVARSQSRHRPAPDLTHPGSV